MDCKNYKNYKNLEPKIRIGKNGLSESIIEEIKLQLRKNKVIKVKFLPSAFDKKQKKEMFDELVNKTNSILKHKVGFVAVIAKKLNKKNDNRIIR